MRPPSLEQLKEILSDDKLQMTIGQVQKIEIAGDRSVLKCKLLLLTEGFSIIARMSWDAVGPNAGFFQFPSIGDLVIVGYIDNNENEAFVLRRLTSKDDKIPLQAVDGHLVMRALAGKKAHLISDTAVLLGRGGADPTQPLVLGTVFKTAYSKDLDETAKHKHIGNLGFFTAVPDNAVEFQTLKASPVDDLAMLSDLSKTEK